MRPKLHSIDALSVACRAGLVRSPTLHDMISAIPAATAGSDALRSRAAASSRANGIPSSSLQIEAMCASACLSTTIPGRASLARTTNSRRASWRSKVSSVTGLVSSGMVNSGTRQTTSPTSPSGCRLVISAARLGAPRQQRREDGGGGVEHVFGVVEHEQRSLAPQPTFELADHVPARNHPDLGRDLLGNIRGRRQHAEIHPPGIGAVAFACGRCDAHRQSRLPAPTRTCEGHDPVGLQERSELGHLPRASDERAQRDRHGRTCRRRDPGLRAPPPGPRRMPRPAEHLAVRARGNGPIELHERSRWLGADLSLQHAAVVLELAQCVSAAPGRVQRPHEQRPRKVAVRLLVDQRQHGGNGSGRLAGVEQEQHQLLDRRRVQLAESSRFDLGPGFVGELVVRRPLPERCRPVRGMTARSRRQREMPR